MINMPRSASIALETLRRHGFCAYIVGGCVRDALRGAEPSDYDITTSALPEETEKAFEGYRIIETGLSHGTVTVLIEGVPIEITTFRIDGEYEDHRRPKEVTFTRSIDEDLARRDFTVNAMAYSPETGLTDLFGGRRDLSDGIIRAVGDPDRRFEEDALRILRAMRFASVLDFEIERETAFAMRRRMGLLGSISAERINTELSKLLLGRGCERILTEYGDILGAVIPEIIPAFGFDQRNPHHAYDVYIHTVKCVVACPPDRNIRMAALLHDIGKPDTFSVGEDGVGHFYGHSDRSLELAVTVLDRLRFDNASKNEILTLIRWHDPVIEESEAAVGRWMRRLGVETLKKLLCLKAADNTAQAKECHGRLQSYERIRGIIDRLVERDACLSLRHLAVKGGDLISVGFRTGKRLGEALDILLDAVISGELPNEREALLDYARKML